jgi:hypothetical protein
MRCGAQNWTPSSCALGRAADGKKTMGKPGKNMGTSVQMEVLVGIYGDLWGFYLDEF